jgi:hypothetical protein
MRSEGRPKEVGRAVFEDDHGALSAMGKKGAETAARNRALRKEAEELSRDAQKTRLKEAELEQAEVLSVSPEGDVLPADPKIVEALKEQLRG